MKRNAFTLTELLVVVVIIGVLSAVVLPKFSKVVETRKTTEAEEMMAAVRNEQEARCTLSKNYTDIEKLDSYRTGTNFNYANNDEGVGIIATAKNNKYKLEIPSYADGRVCCSDIEPGACASLNKSYPLCSDLINNTSDYVAGNADCGIPGAGENSQPEPIPTECTDGQEQEQACSNNCGDSGVQKNRCEGGHWSGWGACSVADKASCGECTPGQTEEKTCNLCGKQTRTCQENRTWGEWEKCSVNKPLECFVETDCVTPKPATQQACGCTGTQTRSVTCMPKLMLDPLIAQIEANEGPLTNDPLLQNGSSGIWVTGKWGACEGDKPEQCNDELKCGGRPRSQWHCNPGERRPGPVVSLSGETLRHTCKKWIKDSSVQTRISVGQASEYVLEEAPAGKDEVTPNNEDKNVDSKSLGWHSEDYEGMYECVDTCALWLSNKEACTTNCDWQEVRCGSRPGGGGGGGGGGGEGGGSGGGGGGMDFFQESTVESEGVEVHEFEICVERTSGQGIWQQTHLHCTTYHI